MHLADSVFIDSVDDVVCTEPLPAVSQVALSPAQLLVKRGFDLALAIPLLLACLPLFILISLLVWITSPGPALFRQRRVGHRGKKFVLYKFRSMYLCDEDAHRSYARDWIRKGEEARQHNGTFKIAHDPRITPVGRILRKFSFDELPQLLNVVLGNMSLVGPRPAIRYEVQEYENWQRQRLNTPPGLTGLWQISGRNRLSFERMVELDVKYIRNWSLLADIGILLRTVPVVLLGTGQ